MVAKSLHAALGATYPIGGEQITLFIPSTDRSGQAIDQEHWTDEALGTLGRLFRGATAFPPGKGVWRNDAKGGALLYETTVMVISYVPKVELQKNLAELRVFLHRFGREANQGEVGVIINQDYFGISTYDRE